MNRNKYYLPSTFTPIRKRAFIFISPCSPKAKLDFVTKLSRCQGNMGTPSFRDPIVNIGTPHRKVNLASRLAS